jgi:hypothetical protein
MAAAAERLPAFTQLGENSRQRTVRLFSARSVATATLHTLLPQMEVLLNDEYAIAS